MNGWFCNKKGLLRRSVSFNFPFGLKKYSCFCLIKNKNLTILSVVKENSFFSSTFSILNGTFVRPPTWNTNFPLTPTPPCDHFLNYNEPHPSPPPETIRSLWIIFNYLFEMKRHSGLNCFWKKTWKLYTVRYSLQYVLKFRIYSTVQIKKKHSRNKIILYKAKAVVNLT